MLPVGRVGKVLKPQIIYDLAARLLDGPPYVFCRLLFLLTLRLFPVFLCTEYSPMEKNILLKGLLYDNLLDWRLIVENSMAFSVGIRDTPSRSSPIKVTT
ncbi:hypothetical protein NPIL_410411 [Nephila pilipes]|uniref:Uncharacterized protein n=1 Tax=Nephila pilipes TaxID=299642 RepID=A0A8X6NF21_NEPPI|nr:hypothetical protein NPIL_410411 [Nephila pilipes]